MPVSPLSSQTREVLTEHATIPWILAVPPGDSALGSVVTGAKFWRAGWTIKRGHG